MPADKKPTIWYKDLFAQMRLACAEPDGEFVPYAVLRISVEHHVPFPRWAALALLAHGSHLLETPTRKGHNPRPIDRDYQRSVDEMRYAVVEKFRRTEKLSWRDAVERAVGFLGTTMSGSIVGHNGRLFRLNGESGAIEASYTREAKRRKNGRFFPQLRIE
jgi:hypothetical protein